MVGTLCLIALSTALVGEVKVDAGYEPIDGGGMQYYLAIAPESIEQLRTSGHTHQVPAEVSDIRRVRVLIGNYQLPKTKGLPVNRPRVDPKLTIPIVASSIEAFSNDGTDYDVPTALRHARRIDLRIGSAAPPLAVTQQTPPAKSAEPPLIQVPDYGNSPGTDGLFGNSTATAGPNLSTPPAQTPTPSTSAWSTQQPAPSGQITGNPGESTRAPTDLGPTSAGTTSPFDYSGNRQSEQQLQSDARGSAFDANRDRDDRIARGRSGSTTNTARAPFGDDASKTANTSQTFRANTGAGTTDTPVKEGKSPRDISNVNNGNAQEAASRPWGVLVGLALLLVLSLVFNAFLAYLHYESRIRYRALLGRVHSDRHEAAAK